MTYVLGFVVIVMYVNQELYQRQSAACLGVQLCLHEIKSAPAEEALQGSQFVCCVPCGVVEEMVHVLLCCCNVEVANNNDLCVG
jgi:hypothetical protein